MSRIKSFFKSTKGKWLLRALMIGGTAYAFYLGYEKVSSWNGMPFHLVFSVGALALLAGAIVSSAVAGLAKAYSWRRMCPPDGRPSLLTLAAASGASSVAALLLPGEFCDAVRIWVVRKLNPRQDIGTVAVSLGTSGMLDPVAMAPFAFIAAAVLTVSSVFQLGLIGYGVVGLVLACTIIFLPKAMHHPKLAKHKVVCWMARRWPAHDDALHGFCGSLIAYLLRTLSMTLLLLALGIGGSVSLLLLFAMMLAVQCAGAIAMIVPIAPSATQAGAAGAVLASAGIGANAALAFGIAAQFMAAAAGLLFVVGLLVTLIRRKLTAGKGTSGGADEHGNRK